MRFYTANHFSFHLFPIQFLLLVVRISISINRKLSKLASFFSRFKSPSWAKVEFSQCVSLFQPFNFSHSNSYESWRNTFLIWRCFERKKSAGIFIKYVLYCLLKAFELMRGGFFSVRAPGFE